MADQRIAERLQPSLLDRLTDRDPDAAGEARDERVIDMRRLREILQRDLSWLLNTSSNDARIDAALYPHAARSVLNYGLGEVSGSYATAERAELIRRSILRAIERFEPRIRKGSVLVEMVADTSGRDTLARFDIRADMWAQPLPMELYLRSEVDIATGELRLERGM